MTGGKDLQDAKHEHGAHADLLRRAQSELTDLEDRQAENGKIQHQMGQDGPEEEFRVVDIASGVGDRLIPESLHWDAIYLPIVILAIAYLTNLVHTGQGAGEISWGSFRELYQYLRNTARNV
jgi:hypothetical protein